MFAALVALTLIAPAAPLEGKELPAAAKKELEKLERRWEVTKSANSTGESKPDAQMPKLYLVLKGDELTFEFEGKKETLRVSAVDAGTDPKCIDLLEKLRDNKERTIEGVYKIEKDTLRIALRVPDGAKQRPTGFDKPTDSRTMVLTLKRVKD